MSSIDFNVVANRLTNTRLRSYLRASGGAVVPAMRLYDWNTSVSSSLYEDLGRLEVVFRNAVDGALVKHGTSKEWLSVWYRQTQLFPGKGAARTRADIQVARQRATRGGRLPEVHGKVIAELSFGFWRYLSSRSYLTSPWLPALAAAFPLHSSAGQPRVVRAEVEDRMQRLHFLRNRIAHHEPIHRRDLFRDHAHLLELAGWICLECQKWMAAKSRTLDVIAARPQVLGSYIARE